MLGCTVFHLHETCHIVVFLYFLLVGRRRSILVDLLVVFVVETWIALASEDCVVLLVGTIAVLAIGGSGTVLDPGVVWLVSTGARELVLLLERNNVIGHETPFALWQTGLVGFVDQARRDVVFSSGYQASTLHHIVKESFLFPVSDLETKGFVERCLLRHCVVGQTDVSLAPYTVSHEFFCSDFYRGHVMNTDGAYWFRDAAVRTASWELIRSIFPDC